MVPILAFNNVCQLFQGFQLLGDVAMKKLKPSRRNSMAKPK
jgi:hypothetical protein